VICKCDACDDPPPMNNLTRCSVCQVLLCARCWIVHYGERVRDGERSLCHQIERTAWDHAQFRRAAHEYGEWIPPDAEHLFPVGARPPDDAFPPQEADWLAARDHYLYDLRHRSHQC
jgi:hypothetical protein